MKRFLVYITVLVGVLFVGLTTYYFTKSDEYIGYVNAADNYQTYYMNKGDSMALPIVHTKPNPDTKIIVFSSKLTVAGYNEETGKIIAMGGGICTITITTSNGNFGPFIFSIQVGDGTKGNPWLVDSADTLRKVGVGMYLLSDSYKVISNITLTETFTPIGLSSNPVGEFSGIFDGNFKSISGLQITCDAEKAGLFSIVAGSGVVKNVILSNVIVSGAYDYAGAIAGENRGEIYKCSVENSTIKSSAENATIGGLVGQMRISYELDARNVAEVSMCSFSGTLGQIETKDFEPAAVLGGLVGESLAGMITNSYANISVIILNDQTSVGALLGTFDYCLYNQNKTFLVMRNNYAVLNGSFTSSNKGFVGSYDKDSALSDNSIKRIAGNKYFSETSGDYVELTGTVRVLKKEDMQGFENIGLYVSETGDSWNISTNKGATVWYLDSGFPKLNLDAEKEIFEIVIVDYTEISSIEELLNFYNKATVPGLSWDKLQALTSSYKVTKNGENARVFDLGGMIWTPIGTSKEPFCGSFNGNGVTIKNFIINSITDKVDSLGFFGVIAGSKVVIENINFENVTIISDSNDYAGVVAGFVSSATIKNCTVKNITIKNANVAGFIAGYNDGNIKTTTMNEKGVYNYSVLEYNENNITNKIYSDTENSYVYGGIVGINFGTITNAKIQGLFEISGATTNQEQNIKTIGGLVGINPNGKIISSSIEQGKLFDLSAQVVIGGITAFNGINDSDGGKVGKIEYCHVGNETLKTTMEAASTGTIKTMVGGLVVTNFEKSVINTSFAIVEISNGYYTAGFAVVNKGDIDQVYSKGKIKGHYAGGFAVANVGNITNAYTNVVLNGVDEKSKLAGAVVFLASPGIVDKCVVNTSYDAVGEADIETFTKIEADMVKNMRDLINKTFKFGTIQNVLVNITAAGRAYDYATSFGKALIKSVTYKTQQDCKDQVNEIVTALKLDTVWRVTDKNVLELKNLDFDGVSQNVVFKEEK